MCHFELLRGMLQRMFEPQTLPEQMPGKEEGELRNPATRRCSEALVRLLVLMQGVQAEPRKRSLSESPGGRRKPMEDDSNLLCQARRRKEKRPGEGKYRRRSWWEKRKENVASFLTAERKEEEKER